VVPFVSSFRQEDRRQKVSEGVSSIGTGTFVLVFHTFSSSIQDEILTRSVLLEHPEIRENANFSTRRLEKMGTGFSSLDTTKHTVQEWD
jgi:hypothetical protein